MKNILMQKTVGDLELRVKKNKICGVKKAIILV